MFKISVLIGAHYYWDFVEDEVVRGNGPTAVKLKLGYSTLRTDTTKKDELKRS